MSTSDSDKAKGASAKREPKWNDDSKVSYDLPNPNWRSDASNGSDSSFDSGGAAGVKHAEESAKTSLPIELYSPELKKLITEYRQKKKADKDESSAAQSKYTDPGTIHSSPKNNWQPRESEQKSRLAEPDAGPERLAEQPRTPVSNPHPSVPSHENGDLEAWTDQSAELPDLDSAEDHEPIIEHSEALEEILDGLTQELEAEKREQALNSQPPRNHDEVSREPEGPAEKQEPFEERPDPVEVQEESSEPGEIARESTPASSRNWGLNLTKSSLFQRGADAGEPKREFNTKSPVDEPPAERESKAAPLIPISGNSRGGEKPPELHPGSSDPYQSAPRLQVNPTGSNASAGSSDRSAKWQPITPKLPLKERHQEPNLAEQAMTGEALEESISINSPRLGLGSEGAVMGSPSAEIAAGISKKALDAENLTWPEYGASKESASSPGGLGGDWRRAAEADWSGQNSPAPEFKPVVPTADWRSGLNPTQEIDQPLSAKSSEERAAAQSELKAKAMKQELKPQLPSTKTKRKNFVLLYGMMVVFVGAGLAYYLLPSLKSSDGLLDVLVVPANLDDSVVSVPQNNQPEEVGPERAIFQSEETGLSENVAVVDNREQPILLGREDPLNPPPTETIAETTTAPTAVAATAPNALTTTQPTAATTVETDANDASERAAAQAIINRVAAATGQDPVQEPEFQSIVDAALQAVATNSTEASIDDSTVDLVEPINIGAEQNVRPLGGEQQPDAQTGGSQSDAVSAAIENLPVPPVVTVESVAANQNQGFNFGSGPKPRPGNIPVPVIPVIPEPQTSVRAVAPADIQPADIVISVATGQAEPFTQPEPVATTQVEPPTQPALPVQAARTTAPSNDPNAPTPITIPFLRDDASVQAPARAPVTPARPQAVTPAANPRPTTAPAQTGSGYEVQISSQVTEADGNATLRKLGQRLGGVVTNYRGYVRSDVVDGIGTRYRVLLGQFGSSADASRVCSAIKGAGGDCFIRRLR